MKRFLLLLVLGSAIVPTIVHAADPFWVARPPRQWTDAELDGIFQNSPWAQTDGITVYLSTAAPMRAAEQELLRRRGQLSAEVAHDTDYDEFVRERASQVIVVAVRAKDQSGLSVAGEMDRLRRDSRIRTGKKYLKLEALFPPSPGDPVLRLVFARDLDPKADKVRLELYIPALDGKAWRTFEFPVKLMEVGGKLEI